jgi:hypothetical protein
MQSDLITYHQKLGPEDQEICYKLYDLILAGLPEANVKIWHAHPVWFLNENPIVGYHKLKDSVRLLFWSGQSFEEPMLKKEGSFKAAETRYTRVDQIQTEDLLRWLAKARSIQWDYKNIRKMKGKLTRLV